TVHVAHAFARERSVGEAGERHVAAGGRSEHVARSRWIGKPPGERNEHRVDGAERNPQLSLMDQSESDESAGVVARPRDHLRGAEAITRAPVRGDLADDGPGV